MEIRPCVQIRQNNDPELLEFFNAYHVQHRLVGDHLFIIRGRGGEVAAGPGDWLAISAGGDVDVQRGDYAERARRAALRVRHSRRERELDYRESAVTRG